MLACALLPAGCYGPSKSLAEPVVLAAEDEEDEPLPKPAAPPAAPPKKEEPPKEPEPPPPPKRPAQVADWKPEDFLSAKRDRDPALLQAVQHLVRSGAKDEETIRLLANLLQVEEEDAARPLTSTPSVASAVIPFFATLESSMAQQTLQGLLKGDVRAEGDEAQCVELVLRALVETPSPAHEELLGDILTQPSRWRAWDASGVTADRLHEMCFKLIQPVASAALRMRLAHYIVQGVTPAEHRERIGPWLAAPEPINLGAQVVLHNSQMLSPEAKTRFRDTFAKLNSAALDQLLGVTTVFNAPAGQSLRLTTATAPRSNGLFVSPAASALSAGTVEEPDQAAAVARHFWTREFMANVAADLSRMADLGAQRELMLLASNLPYQAVRVEMHRALRRQWVEGTAPFEAARLTLDAFRDPGFLVLVKAMPREEQKPMTGAAAANQPKPTKERLAKFAWMGAAESFVRSLNERFYAAARANPLPAQPSAENELPLALAKGLSVAAEYHVLWPTQLERLQDLAVDPLVLHYVRLEGEERFQKVSDFYRRQLESPACRNVARGQWLESQQGDETTRQIRSVDVLITRSEPPPRSTTMPENLLVEILWIEIPDPTR
jgi:hypothetical protein